MSTRENLAAKRRRERLRWGEGAIVAVKCDLPKAAALRDRPKGTRAKRSLETSPPDTACNSPSPN